VDQPDIFGDFVRWRFDLPAPSLDVDPASVLTTVDQAVYRAERSPKGPVHLNLMFREPLIPGPDEDESPAAGPERWRDASEPYTRYATTEPTVDDTQIGALWERLRPVGRGLVVAGRLATRAQGEAVERLALTLGWPLLPDVGSQVRLGGDRRNAAFYDVLLADAVFADAHAPEAVLHFGGRALSKRLEGFVTRHRPDPYVIVRENPFRLDPGHLVTHSVESGIEDFCASLGRAASERPSAADATWAAAWRAASAKVESVLDRALGSGDGLDEPLVARLVSREVAEGHGLVVASSMPIRDLDAFAAADGAGVPVAANRGASGIDGTVATAAGFARGTGGPVTLLIGDLALLHDLNSLAMLRGLPVTVVVLNNDGGGIFSFLPVSEHKPFFEPFFGTPQGVGFAPAAAMFGLRYESPETPQKFLSAYRASRSGDGPSLIEVRTDRDDNVALHRRLLEEAAAGVGEEA
jgi:2-succinyl-5-enolpyruvyl-6-hydroxy-3-cyclohexene-1-carboxylate synthase